MKDYTKQTWTSLSQLASTIEKDKSEKIKDFLGYELITNKYRYGLYDGILIRNPIKKNRGNDDS